ncbi:hypothetical protein [Gracilibacillus oryzae]|uniref:hypothetical protein n=1 Tax=Gracilibacillus oryzae TaxID=1672701 RepID=UPI001296A4A9|nr:hypothetical protein [Gracilibacillus oryzae]
MKAAEIKRKLFKSATIFETAPAFELDALPKDPALGFIFTKYILITCKGACY